MTQRVLYVNTPTYLGGAEVSLLTLMEHLDSDRYGAVLLTAGESTLGDRAQAAGIPVHRQDFPWFSRRRPWEYLCSIYRLVRTTRAEQICLMHTNCDHSLRYVMQVSRLTGVPYVSHVRDFTRAWFQPQSLQALNRAERVIANSDAIAAACAEAGVPPARVRTVYNPIDSDPFFTVPRSTIRRVRSALGLRTNDLVIGIVGHVAPLKGHVEFLEAASRLVDEFYRLRFLIVGMPPPGESHESFAANLQRRVAQSELTDFVQFTGFRDDIPAIMRALDILAVPSWEEPFGRVAVEGLAAGCAVVGTAVGGLPEIITHEVDGMLVPPKDVDALTAGLRRLIGDPQLRQRLSERGVCTATRFSVAKHVAEIEALYDDVLQKD